MTRRLAHLARGLQSRLERLFDAPLAADATPLEISQAVVDDIERKLQPVGRGRRIFPYSRVAVRIRQANGDRAALEAAFAGIGDRIRERFAELQCETPPSLEVKVILLRKRPQDWPADKHYAIEYAAPAESAGASAAAASMPSMNISIVKGAATRKAYSFNEATISIGRTPDPTGDPAAARRNRVAFLDTADGVTETVGRAHAHFRYDPRSREYRLFDDGSSNGTTIVRNGAAIPVPSRDPRGVRVCSGDEVQVGRAVLRITIAPAQTPPVP